MLHCLMDFFNAVFGTASVTRVFVVCIQMEEEQGKSSLVRFPIYISAPNYTS